MTPPLGFEFGFGRDAFVKAGCKVTNCWATDDRSWLNRSDAVIFHAFDYDPDDLPDPVSRRLDSQRYVFLNNEALPATPDKTNYDVFQFSPAHFFNWTMTFRKNSDFISHYGSIVPVEHHQQNLTTNRATNKTKFMVWFVSNCNTTGRREKYMRKLSKFIPVDFYGTCGFGKNQLSCKPNKVYVTKREICFQRIVPRYKFEFAAENNVCSDYVTEKLFRPLRLGTVPVVYGGADYSQFAPRGSYINVADFPSPKDLADYLLKVDKDDALYSTYFEWTKHWRAVERYPQADFCGLCEKLNDPAQPLKSYSNITKWWFDGDPCYVTGPAPFMPIEPRL